MKKIIMGALLLASTNCLGGELVKGAEIIGINTPEDIKDISIIVTVKGGEGVCAGKEIRFPLIKMRADLYFNVIRDTIYAGFANSAKVTIGNFKGKQDCKEATYIKLSK